MSPRARRDGKAEPQAQPGSNGAPGPVSGRRGRAAARQAFLAQRAGIVDPKEAALALERRRAQLAAQAEQPHVRGAAREAPTGGDADLWVPIGPSVVLGGQAGGRPRVAGRVRDLRVSDNGLRAYAATANGGVWYTPDGGETWSPLGGWGVSHTPPNVTVPSNVLVCGCIYVRFDSGGNAANDEVLVGTGELTPQLLTTPLLQGGLQGWPGGSASSVGVIRSVGPATKDEFAQVWDVEGTNLAGRGIFRLVGNPDESPPTTFVAATSGGAWTRTGGPTAAWSPVPAAPFNTGPGGALICTDAAWAKGVGATPTRLWIAVRDDVGGSSSLWVSTNGTAGPFAPVALPGLAPGSRISIAVSPSNPAVVYALADQDQVWRIDGVAVKSVTSIPTRLLRGQDSYDQAIAVHPTHPEKLVLGGATAKSDGEWSAALYMANVTGPVGSGASSHYVFGFSTPVTATSNPTSDNSYIGNGVHADVHVARFAPVPGKTELWIGCDGGVFRSQQGDATNVQMKSSFVPRNTGIAVLEPGYVATHPSVDGYVLAGTQDNGTLERVGDTVWRGRFLGDGGGVAFNPAAPHRFIRQYIQGQWNSDGSVAFTNPVLRTTGGATGATAMEASEHGNANFYTGTDAVLVGPGSARVAFGTYRVWYSSDWGQTWATLPSLTDPMALASQNANTDAILTGSGGGPLTDARVVAVRWASPTRLYVLCRRIVLRYDFVADASVTGGLRVTTTVLSRQAPGKCEDPQAAATVASPGQVLPAVGEWSDLAVHDPSRGSHGSFYVAATGDPTTPTMDTLWWFDGTDRWHATGLRTDATHGVPAPAYAVAVHPTDPTVVFVGTSVGVWKGTLTIGDPKWDWQVFCKGLPEATVQDLTTVNTGGVRLLRAAMQARGVWEVNLQGPGTAQTYLRVHPWDTRRAPTTALVDPTRPAVAPALSWHASPDVRVRPHRGSVPPRPTGLPWIGASSDPYGLWVFQTALHGKPDPLCKPDGQWTPLFEARLRAATGGGKKVTQAIWETVVGKGASFPNAYADPWNGTSPTEADLIELIRDLPFPAASPASMVIRPGAARVDVLVHHRHLTPAAASDVKVTLLRRDVSGTAAAAWAALAGGWTAAVQTFLRSGGAAPALAGGWTFADSGTPVRSPDGPVDARLPRAVTFDTDFTGVAKGSRLLLVAVAHSAADQVTLPSQTLQTLALGARFVAVRSVEIVGIA